jgi:hypothetical protein
MQEHSYSLSSPHSHVLIHSWVFVHTVCSVQSELSHSHCPSERNPIFKDRYIHHQLFWDFSLSLINKIYHSLQKTLLMPPAKFWFRFFTTHQVTTAALNLPGSPGLSYFVLTTFPMTSDSVHACLYFCFSEFTCIGIDPTDFSFWASLGTIIWILL